MKVEGEYFCPTILAWFVAKKFQLLQATAAQPHPNFSATAVINPSPSSI
jgi:hypothetical protein